MISSLFRRMRQTIYALLRQWGTAITVCRTTGDNFDTVTGAITNNLIKVAIRRAAVLSGESIRTFSYDLSFIAANKNFTLGGFYDDQTRLFVIKQRDMPSDFPINQDMHIVCQGVRYEAKKLGTYDGSEFFWVLGEAVRGSPVLDEHALDLTTEVGTSDDPEATVT